MSAVAAESISKSCIMLITNKLENSPTGGRAMLCKLNHDALKQIYGESLVKLELQSFPLQGLRSIVKAFQGHIDGLTDVMIDQILKTITTKSISKVFVDGSNMGEIVRAIKYYSPFVEVTTFCHNVEARFFWGSFRQAKTLRSLAVLIVNYLAERKSVRYSDKLICLSERDSRLLYKIYGRAATHVSALALQDQPSATVVKTEKLHHGKLILFVGGGFYANLAGINWFVKHVAPLINIKTYIVGKGFEEFKNLLELNGKVEIVGAVDSLAQWYHDSHFVIAPIFDGSGMKTKVAEALMFGKKIIGTPEAFSGYEDVVKLVGWECLTSDEFVAAIKCAQDQPLKSFDPELRALYDERYSFVAARERLALILGDESLR